MKFLNNLVKLFRGKDDGLNGIRFLVLVLPLGCILAKIFAMVGSYAVSMGIASQYAADMGVLVVIILAMAFLGGFAGQMVFMSKGQGKQGVK